MNSQSVQRDSKKFQSIISHRDDEIASGKLHTLLTVKQIVAMKDRFEKMPGRHMSKNTFRRALLEVGRIIMTDEEFDTLCRQMSFVRTTTEPEVYWEEFLTNLRVGLDSENIEKYSGKLNLPICGTPKELKSYHRLPISRIIFVPEIQQVDRVVNHLYGVYMTCSRDGLINYWSLDLELERTVYTKSPKLKSQATWITDVVSLPDVNVICTCSTERDLRFYDTTANKFELRIYVTSLEEMITAMYYTFYRDINTESRLIIGNAIGKVIHISVESKDRGPFKSLPKSTLRTTTYSQFLKGSIPGMKVEEIHSEHTDWVRQVSYYESIHCLVSISTCSKESMLIHNTTSKKDTNYSFKVLKGFTCFVIADGLHAVITGGPDYLVRVWNPVIPSRPITVLSGHHAAIVSIILQDDNRVLVSLDKDKCIKVWDVTEQVCLQSYFGMPYSLGERTPLCTYYNPCSRQYFVASNRITYIEVYPPLNGEYTDGVSHSKEVSVILYNPLFKSIITCGFDSFIIAWNPWQGKILVMGENRIVTEFADCEDIGSSNYKSWMSRHQDDILCAATYLPTTLVTASYSGELVFWRLETGQPYGMYNVSNPSERTKQLFTVNKSSVKEESGEALRTVKTRTRYPGIQSRAVNLGGGNKVDNRESKICKLDHRESHTCKLDHRDSKNCKLEHRDSKDYEVEYRDSMTGREHKISVNVMVTFIARPVHPQIGTLAVALDDGKIQIWSIHAGGGYITQFKSVHSLKDYVVSLCTDKKNQYLFTGHMTGYIKTWHMVNYCVLAEDKVHVSMPRLRLQFPFMWNDFFLGRAKRAHRKNVPLLLNSIKAHLKPVTGLVYVDNVKMMVSCSSDGSARIWTLGGKYMGTLGTFKPWTYISPTVEADNTRAYPLPADIQRSASFTTFRVMTGGIVEKRLTKKQQQQQFDGKGIISDKVYGKRIHLHNVLGKHFKLPKRGFHHYDIMLDTSLPDVPVYSEMIMPTPEKIKRPATPELMRHLKFQRRLTMSKIEAYRNSRCSI